MGKRSGSGGAKGWERRDGEWEQISMHGIRMHNLNSLSNLAERISKPLHRWLPARRQRQKRLQQACILDNVTCPQLAQRKRRRDNEEFEGLAVLTSNMLSQQILVGLLYG